MALALRGSEGRPVWLRGGGAEGRLGRRRGLERCEFGEGGREGRRSSGERRDNGVGGAGDLAKEGDSGGLQCPTASLAAAVVASRWPQPREGARVWEAATRKGSCGGRGERGGAALVRRTFWEAPNLLFLGRTCARCVWKFREEVNGARDGRAGGSGDVIGRT
ncbi:unnamed protein product [Miscanthus lutarioriparius]|uniref:Uncharacterized protein n=1 Tax=Miscanthus lutarioriparius TaxID=422564 RepID=A0A811Q354_9POAL|nr:unnamed protein product [Miscanthus lutarioriparius]